ncbi:MAG: hypothetical protein E7611_00535 [Ruminococcaceae bacterium]|nr:hypothetical protein [Oscillospiraceae bacterium]
MLARRVLALARQGSYKKWCDRYGFETIRRLAEEGFSDEEIAERCGLTFDVFQRWRKKYAKFRDAIEIGRKEADFSVVEALYKKATGYSVKTNKTHKLKRVDYDPDTGKKVKEYEELAVGFDESYVPPDLKAEIFWLKNRQPCRWKEKELHVDDGEDGEGGIVEIPRADRIGDLEDGGE